MTVQTESEDALAAGPTGVLSVRAAEPSDAEAISAISNLPGFRHNTLRPPFATVASTRRWLESRVSSDIHLVGLLDGKVIASGGLHVFGGRRSHAGNIGMGVHDAYRRRGVGLLLISSLLDAADNWLGLKRVELATFVDNHAAIALYQRVGFEREGVFRDYALREGVLVDALTMARIKA